MKNRLFVHGYLLIPAIINLPGLSVGTVKTNAKGE
jgi:hypothetical protein